MLVIWRVDGVEEIFVGKFGVVYFDTKIFADAGEEIGGVDGLIGIGLQFFIEAGGDVAQGGGAAGDFGGDKAGVHGGFERRKAPDQLKVKIRPIESDSPTD